MKINRELVKKLFKTQRKTKVVAENFDATETVYWKVSLWRFHLVMTEFQMMLGTTFWYASAKLPRVKRELLPRFFVDMNKRKSNPLVRLFNKLENDWNEKMEREEMAYAESMYDAYYGIDRDPDPKYDMHGRVPNSWLTDRGGR